MRTALSAFTAILLLTGCAEPPPDDKAERWQRMLSPRIGLSEADLVRTMKRMPDASYQQDARTRMLRWTIDTSYTRRGQSPEYIYTPSTGIIPVGGTPDREIQQSCNVEWIVVDGKANGYSLRGRGCP